MKNKNVRGILALAVVTALSFGVIVGSNALSKNQNTGEDTSEEKVLEELDVAGAEHIEKAVKTENGYVVTVKTKGYGGDIVMNVSFDAEGKNVTKVEVTEQSETQNVGSKITEPEFLNQFAGVEAPVYLPGMSLGEEEKETTDELEGAELQDGTYEAKADSADSSGFTDQMTMTVKDGKITEMTWESVGEDGSKKSVMSEEGEYVMTEDGLTWKEQAEALAAAVIEHQNISFLEMDEQGKTDAVTGVSISVGGFADLAEKCMKEAAGLSETVELKDGTYEAKTDSADSSGFTDQVSVTVKDGKITEVSWESVKEDGSKKSVMSEEGEYVMTEDGLTWKEQAEALAAAMVEHQNLEFLNIDEQGKTDAVAGVSIAVSGFAKLAEQCLNEAAGVETEVQTPQNGTQVDAVSGATISSTAAVTGINEAYEFLNAAK